MKKHLSILLLGFVAFALTSSQVGDMPWPPCYPCTSQSGMGQLVSRPSHFESAVSRVYPLPDGRGSEPPYVSMRVDVSAFQRN
jgi:hypothetical protein